MARLDFANHKEDCLLGTRIYVESFVNMLDELAQSGYGHLKHFKVYLFILGQTHRTRADESSKVEVGRVQRRF